MSPQILLAALLAAAVLLAWARLARWHAAAPPEARSPTWRLAVLLAAQPVCALLLYLTLVPPAVRTAAGTLVVATRGAGPLTGAAGDHVVALPEASALAAAERVPDLGTALRRYPDTRRIQVIGEGLPPRDRDAARGVELSFKPGDAPTGIVRLDPPERVAPGAAFRIGGRVAGPGNAAVELLDPAGRVADRAPLDPDGGFALRGAARGAGAMLFRLRVRDAGRRIIEEAEVPVVIADDAAPRVLLLAGAPGPEPKFLRRWATDAGLELHTQLPTGGGIALGDEPLPINGATLRRFDLAILDDRSWAALAPGERGALIGAVRGGLGLLLRITGAVPEAARQQWRELGFAVSGGTEVASVRLAGQPAPANDDGSLTRRAVRIAAADDVVLLRDAGGQALANWRAVGRGRVALWPLTDSFVLALGGADARYAELWSEAFSALARSRPAAVPDIPAVARAGQRVAICGLGADATVTPPDAGMTRLVVEPPTGCAAFWPSRPGWHLLRDGANAVPYYVQPANALPAIRAAEAREATLRLVGGSKTGGAVTAGRPRPGASWPWFLAWLATSAGLWWFERRRGVAG